MDSKFDKLLENDDRYKLFIYQILQIKKEAGVSIGELKQQVELSDFKFNQLLEELKTDLVGSNSKLIIDDNKFLTTKSFSSKDYQTLRLSYFKKSVAVDFLLKVGLFESTSMSEFADLHFMSSSSVYRIQNEINDFLTDYGLRLKSAKVTGDEKNIRSFYFQLIFNYYGGMESPFSERIAALIDNDIATLEKLFLDNISEIQLTQLTIFLGVQIYRIRNAHYVKNKVYAKFELTEFLDILKSDFSLREIPKSESEYLHLYLMLNQYIDFDNSLQLKTNALETSFINLLDKHLKISNLKKFHDIQHEIHIISQRWFNFQLTTTTFISTEQLEFFAQSYPVLHDLVYQFTLNLNRIDGHKVSDFEKTYLYYELMFCLLSFNDVKNYESSIKILVDFSGGSHYNQYISENIEYFKYLNIQLTDHLTADTDIYISDFSNARVNCLQIIWKSPPLDSDWEEFANAVVALKGQNNE